MRIAFYFILTCGFFFAPSCGMGLKPEASVGHFSDIGGASNSDGTVTVTITGSGFVDGITVVVNGYSCTNVQVLSATQLTCILPNGTIALVNVILTSPGGGSSGSSLSSPLISMTAASVVELNEVNAVSVQNINNILANDGSYATFPYDTDGEHSGARAKGYFFSSAYTLSSSATISGIQVNCKWAYSIGQSPQYLRLLKSGNPVGTTKSSNNLPTTLTLSGNYGSNTDKWGDAWTPSEINDPGFGVQLIFGNGIMPSGEAYLDYCQISVYWVP